MSRFLALRNHFGSIRLMALQFLSLAGIGIVWPYVNVYLTELEFSGTAIGTLGSAGAMLSLVLTPLFNQVADRLLLHRRLFMMYMGGFALANIIFATSRIQLLIVLAVLLSRLTISPSLTLGMQLTITFLMSRGKAILGQLRSFASLGFTLASLLAGQLFALGGYPVLFWVAAAIALLTILSSTIFPDKFREKPKTEEATNRPRNRGFYVMAASQFFVAMGTYNMYSFIFIHFNQNLGVPSAHIGLWAALMGAVEFPFFFLMDAVLPKVRIRVAYIIGMLGTSLFALLPGCRAELAIACGAIDTARFGLALLSAVFIYTCQRDQPSAKCRHQSSDLAGDHAEHRPAADRVVVRLDLRQSGSRRLLRNLRADDHYRRRHRDRRLPPVRREASCRDCLIEQRDSAHENDSIFDTIDGA